MCGIAGIFGFRAEILEQRLHGMGAAMVKRGPDDSGIYIDPVSGLGLVHRRLSILDLSEAGRQPMISKCRRYIIVLNGEIYNFKEIKKVLELEKNVMFWTSDSDTEVLLEAIAAWGIDKALSIIVGMFAFAVWDIKEKKLIIARDRFGEKPVFYGWVGQGLVFASTLHAIKSLPEFRRNVDRNALSLYMRHNCVPSPLSIYEGLYKVPASTYVVFTEKNIRQHSTIEAVKYWSIREVANNSLQNRITKNDQEEINEFEERLERSVVGQMQSDVPLGAFLSGGVDSSLIAALMQKESLKRGRGAINTFTIGVPNSVHDEADRARAIAKHLGTDHNEFYVSSVEAQSVVDELPYIYDEPFADSSQIPTILLCRMTRNKCTVALSGDGGDELFGGYSRYNIAKNIYRFTSTYPELTWLFKIIINTFPIKMWNEILKIVMFTIGKPNKSFLLGDKLYKLNELLEAKTQRQLYMKMISHWDPEEVVNLWKLKETGYDEEWNEDLNFRSNMMLMDAETYLTNDIMTKVDRASMSVSLEARAPYLDHRLYEYAWGLPEDMKVRRGVDKWLLKQILYKYVPRALTEQPKRGFSVPIDEWLRGPLRDWAEPKLSEERLKAEGYFNSKSIRNKWKEHLSGQRNWQFLLWDVLMYQAWLEAQ